MSRSCYGKSNESRLYLYVFNNYKPKSAYSVSQNCRRPPKQRSKCSSPAIVLPSIKQNISLSFEK